MSETTGYNADDFVRSLPPLITIQKACEVRQCHPSHMYVLAGKRRIRLVKDGKKTYVDTASLIADIMALPEADISPPVDRRRVTAT
jgi:hypothetical protein